MEEIGEREEKNSRCENLCQFSNLFRRHTHSHSSRRLKQATSEQARASVQQSHSQIHRVVDTHSKIKMVGSKEVVTNVISSMEEARQNDFQEMQAEFEDSSRVVSDLIEVRSIVMDLDADWECIIDFFNSVLVCVCVCVCGVCVEVVF